MLWTRPRSRVFAIVLLVIVIAASITLRKAIPNQTTRMAIGIVGYLKNMEFEEVSRFAPRVDL